MARRRRLIGMGGGAVLAAVIGTAVPALAASQVWGPVSSVYQGDTVVTGSGSFYNSGSTVNSRMTITDNLALDGNNVYGTTWFYRWTATGWQFLAQKSTQEWGSGTHTQTLSRSYSGLGTLARGEFQACAQMGFPVPDSCSQSVFRTIDW